ncbi:MAG: hypothetical protein KKH61_19995 [Gammaproteobacteria bacterium]|nr:hypothetical protein [Gammaproteobacteria bacterium]
MSKGKERISICFSGLDDDYLVGLVAARLNLCQYALAHMRGILRCKDRERLFRLGIAHACQFRDSDVAEQMWLIRRKSPELFDETVSMSVAPDRWAEIMDAIERFGESPKAKKAHGHTARKVEEDE